VAPVLFWLGERPIYSYGVVVAVATLAAAAWGLGALEDRGLCDPWAGLELIAATLLGALLAGKLGLWWILPEAPSLATLGRSGGIVQLALIGGVAVALVYLRWRRLPVLATLDAVAPAVPLGLAIGRVGCLAAGCCHGAPSSLPWSLTYLDPMAHQLSGVPLGVALHPTPIYLGLASAVTFLVVRAVAARARPAGTALGAFLLLDGLIRVELDGLRGDPRGQLLGLSSGVMLGVMFAIAGLVLLTRDRSGRSDAGRA